MAVSIVLTTAGLFAASESPGQRGSTPTASTPPCYETRFGCSNSQPEQTPIFPNCPNCAAERGERNPTAHFTYTPVNPQPGQQITLDASGSDPGTGVQRSDGRFGTARLTHAWDLNGDGSFETNGGMQPRISTTFADPGSYNVGLQVTNEMGRSATFSDTVTVGAGNEPGPVASTDAGCIGKAPTFAAVVEASSTCFQKVGAQYKTRGRDRVRINGIDLEDPSDRIVVDPEQATVSVENEGTAVVQIGSFSQRVPLDGVGLGNRKFDIPVGTFNGKRFGGLPVKGGLDIALAPGGADLTVQIGLPSVLGGVSGAFTGHIDNDRGFQPAGVKIKAAAAKIKGIIPVGNVELEYQVGPPTRFKGKATINLPTPAYDVSGGMELVGGQFASAFAEVDGLNVPLGSSGVFLQRINFGLQLEPNFRLEGGIGLSAGPPIPGFPSGAVQVDGKLIWQVFPSSWTIRVEGGIKVRELELGDGFVEYRSTGTFLFGASKEWEYKLGSGKLKVDGAVDGWAQREAFNLEGRVGLKVEIPSFPDPSGEGRALVSSRGIAGCIKVSGPLGVGSATVGAGKKWASGSIKFFHDSCDVGDYRATMSQSIPPGGSRDFSVPADLPVVTYAVRGRVAPPRITITGPDGRQTPTPTGDESPAQDDNYLFLQNPDDNTTYVAIARPRPGSYRFTVAPGSEVTSISEARGLPEAQVSARVGGRGRDRTLSYQIAPIPDQVVRFVERGSDVVQTIGTARGSQGDISFQPADGSSRQRRIVALVEQDGLPRDEMEVATYTAPPPIRPGRPRGVSIRRRGSRVRVSWGRARNAARYEATVTLTDGRKLLRTTRRRSLTISRVSRRTGIRVAVHGIATNLRRGPATRAGRRRVK